MTTESDKVYDRHPIDERPRRFETMSGIPMEPVYTPRDIKGSDYARDLADPGEYPFTRGIHADMYRGRLWTRRPPAAFGTPAMTNERIKFLFRQGGTAINLATDGPGEAGVDPDHPLSRHGVGVVGTSLCTMEDMEVFLGGLPLDRTSPNIIIPQPGSSFWFAAYVAVADKWNVPRSQLAGNVQNDPFNQLGCRLDAQTRFFPLDLAVRLCCDTIEWCALNMPRFNTCCLNAYNMREEGISAAEEIAYGISCSTAIFRELLERNTVGIDDFAPRISFFSASNIDFLEEIAKFRAFRRLYARIIKEDFGAKNPRSCWFRCAVETSGSSLTTQQPLNNITRNTIESLAAVLGGCQSVHAAPFDEGLAIPGEVAITTSLRTQQIIAHETGVINSADPLGGSYLIESLTNKLEEEALTIIREIDGAGGMVKFIESGQRDRRFTEAKIAFQKQVQQGERIIVGVNAFKEEEEIEVPGGIFEVPDVEEERVAYIREFRQRRDNGLTGEALDALRRKVDTKYNLIPTIMEAVKANATLGEISDALREAVGFRIRI